jgi:predicted transcriptional regulator
MGNFANGVLSGLTEMETQRANSKARWSAVEAEDAKRETRRANGRYEEMAEQAARFKEEADRFYESMRSNAARLVGCRKVLAAMITLLQQMPADQREQFRDKLVQISRKEIASFDADPANKEKGWISVEKAFGELSENGFLGVV